MEYSLDLRKIRNQKTERLSDKFFGKDLEGNELGFNTYYMEINRQPFFGVSGECHYSRVHENQWEDTILKMKMGGINVVSTYIFWNHHEEEEGNFRFDGNRNIRKFLKFCKKHGMYVIVRIGPFDHGEVRNGGLPDWLYGKPFEVRSGNEGFLSCTRKLYRKLAEQFEGLYFKDGGPIIGTQIENEYMHSAAPWEMVTGVTNEWIPGGDEGVEYMKKLKKIAQEEGIITPFYTCTGWDGAATPTDEMLALWGGYAFWPWIFYDYRGEHPATPEYIYRDNHNNQVPKTYNFEPTYEPESLPYACCEMGGGMACYYHYRFQLPYESVDAMANIKLASGCNFLGYYMYRGGSNPTGEKIPYLNECQCPKISYDYQAAIGEYGQLRPSYYRLKALHLFLQNFRDQFCKMVTVLPEGSQEIDPKDVETLRFAARTDGEGGFLFLNNYQDHVECKEKKDERITLHLPKGDITISGISMAAGEEAILPFGMDLGGVRLVYAKAQPLSVVREEGKTVYFFFTPEGMEAEYCFDQETVTSLDGAVEERDLSEYSAECPNGHRTENSRIVVRPQAGKKFSFVVHGGKGDIEIVTLTREESLGFYEIEKNGRKTVLISESSILYDGEKFSLENPDGKTGATEIAAYPAMKLKAQKGIKEIRTEKEGIWTVARMEWGTDHPKETELTPVQCGPYRYTVQIPEGYEDCKDAMLRIHYQGDVGQAFIDGKLVSDNFSNGAVCEIGLREVWKPKMGREVVILITPKKKDASVNVSSTMAGRTEMLKDAVAVLEQVSVRAVLGAELVIEG